MATSFARFVIVSIFIITLWIIPFSHAGTVAVVYDDSPSMMGSNNSKNPSYDLRFAYASYALQTLRALLSSKDNLIVAFMNDKGFQSTREPQQDIKTLTAKSLIKSNSGSTPYGAVTDAMKLLEKEKDEKDRWLIIITDGEFQNVPSDLAEQIAQFQLKAPGVKVICFGIAAGADNEVFQTWKTQAEATVLNSPPSREISGRMQQVAAMVTANTTGLGIKPDQKGDELTFTSPFPLKRFIILQQSETKGALVEVLEVKAGPNQVKLFPGVHTGTPAVAPKLGKLLSTLHGIVHQVEPDSPGSLIPQDTAVKISLSRGVSDKNNLIILPEVSVSLHVTLFDQTGAEIKPDAMKIYTACPDKAVTVRAKLDFGSANGSLIQNNAGTKVTFYYNKITTPLNWEQSTGSFTANIMAVNGLKAIKTSAEHEGYINIHDTGQLDASHDCTPVIIPVTPRDVSITAGSGGTETHGWSVDVRKLGTETVPPLEITPHVDGKNIGAAELTKWQCRAEAPSELKLDVKPSKSGQGWEIVPGKRWCTPCLTSTGSFPVRIVYNGKSRIQAGEPKDKVITLFVTSDTGGNSTNENITLPASLMMEIRDPGLFLRCWKLIAFVIAMLAFLIWLIGIYKKPRFASGSAIEYRRAGVYAKQNTETLPRSFFYRWIIPYIPESHIIESLKFKAGSSSRHIYLVKEALSENLRKDGFPVDRLGKDLRIEDGEILECRINNNVTESYKYLA